jgi:hypothetical protein
MQLERPADFLESRPDIIMRAADGVDSDRSGYISGEDLLNMDIPNESKTHYYLEQAKNQETIDQVEEYFEPIGYKSHMQKTKSKMLGTTADVDAYIVDLSVLRLLVQGSPMGEIPGEHTFEVFVTGNSKWKAKLMEAAKEEFEDA